MVNECFMSELSVFEIVSDYLRKQGEWEEVQITKTCLDNGDVTFLLFFRKGDFKFLQSVDRTYFEQLVMTVSDNQNAVISTPNGEESWTR